ncbi:MAG: hypothetical protein QW117_01935 [Candidatus Pacearchaeota archaeon]
MTSKEIEFLLNNTGKPIYDSYANMSFSRINLYSALLEIDVTPPIINISGIGNNTKTFERNLIFNYSVSDWQLSNVTLFLLNSSNEVFYNETRNVEGTFNESYFYVENLIPGDYSWYIKVSDKKGNSAISEIRIFEIEDEFNLILYPENNTYTNINQTIFYCNASSQFYNLTNITIYIFNSSNDILKNQIFEVSGNENSSFIEYNFTEEGIYLWGCEVHNENNENKSLNYIIIYDITYPKLINTETLVTSNSATITFNTSEETNATIELIGKENKSNFNYSTIHIFSFNNLESSTNYQYNITFCDRAGNCNFSEGNFTTSSAPYSSGGSASNRGSSIRTIDQTYNLEESQLQEGYTRFLVEDDKIIFDIKNNKHSLTINKITTNYVIILIQSNIINLTLYSGEEKKIDFENDFYYDLYIKLNNIKNNKANLTIKRINEYYKEDITIFNKSEEENKTEIIKEENIQENFYSSNKKLDLILKNKRRVILIASILIILFFVLLKRKNIKVRKLNK